MEGEFGATERIARADYDVNLDSRKLLLRFSAKGT